jgi:histone H3/H4
MAELPKINWTEAMKRAIAEAKARVSSAAKVSLTRRE